MPTCQSKLRIPEFTLAPVGQQPVTSSRQALTKAGKDKASKDPQIFLGKKLLLKASSQLQGRRKTCSPLPSHLKGGSKTRPDIQALHFLSHLQHHHHEERTMSHSTASRLLNLILIIGLLFTVCPNTEDIKMSACRAHPMQCTFLMGISGFFYKQLYVTHLVSVAVHSSAARLSISTRHSSGESKRQQKRSIMEM